MRKNRGSKGSIPQNIQSPREFGQKYVLQSDGKMSSLIVSWYAIYHGTHRNGLKCDFGQSNGKQKIGQNGTDVQKTRRQTETAWIQPKHAHFGQQMLGRIQRKNSKIMA